jgi:hypothetical protein
MSCPVLLSRFRSSVSTDRIRQIVTGAFGLVYFGMVITAAAAITFLSVALSLVAPPNSKPRWETTWQIDRHGYRN